MNYLGIINDFILTFKEDLNLNKITYKENDKELILLCPFCLSENKYKIKLYINKEILLYHCFRCENSGNIFTLGKIFKEYHNHNINLEKSFNFYLNNILSDDGINNILKYNSKKNKYINFVNYFIKDNDIENFYYNYIFIIEKFNNIKEVINKNDIYDDNLKYLSKRLTLDKEYIKTYLSKNNNIDDFIFLNIKENEIYNFTFYKFYGEKRNINGNSRYYKYKIIDLLKSIYNNDSDNNKFITTFPDFSLVKISNHNYQDNNLNLIIVEGMFDLLTIYFYGINNFFENYIKNFDKQKSFINLYMEKKFLENLLNNNNNVYLSHLSGYKNYERFFYFIKSLYYTHNLKFNNIVLLLDRDINLKSLYKIKSIINDIYLSHLENLYNDKINFNIFRINSFIGKDINEILQKTF